MKAKVFILANICLFEIFGLCLTIFMHIQTLLPGFNEKSLELVSQSTYILVPLVFLLALPVTIALAKYKKVQTTLVKGILIGLVACSFIYLNYTNITNSVFLAENNLGGGVLWEQKDGSHVLQNHGTLIKTLSGKEYLIRANRDYRSLTAALLLAYTIFGSGLFMICFRKRPQATN